jgi:5'-deoxynucleotidase YfbR-like HD superfamily hydrolase
MNPVSKIRSLREAGHVRRCHTLPHHGSYDVAQHSWQAVALLFHLHPDPTRDLIWALLFHDAAERFYGDQPAQAGWADPELRKRQKEAEAKALTTMGLAFELNPSDKQWLEALDKLELLLWCDDQEALGNRHVKNCADLLRNWFRAEWDDLPKPVQNFFSTFQWERGNEQI